MKQRMTKPIFINLLLLFLLSASIIVPADAATIDVKNDYFTLDNGLKVLLVSDAKSGMTSITSAFRFGAAYDLKGKDGYAHFTFMTVERMMTKIHKDEYDKILSTEGAAFSSEFGRDTALFTTTCKKDELETVLRIEAERMSLGYADPDEFDAVKRLKMAKFLKGEFEQPENKTKFYLRGALYPYWEYYHLEDGDQADVQIARIQEIERSINWYYAPSNASIVIKGPINKNQLKQTITEIFGPLQKSEISPQTYSNFAIDERTHRLAYENPDLKLPALCFSFRIPPITNKDFPAFKIINQLLFAEKSSRIGRYASASKILQGYYTIFTDTAGPNIIGAIFFLPDSAYFDSMQEFYNDEIKQISEGRFSDTEYNNAKQATLREENETLSGPNYTKTLARLLLIFSKVSEITEYFTALQKLDKQSVIKTVSTYLVEPNSCIVYCTK